MTDRKLRASLGIGIFVGQLILVLLVLLSPLYGVDAPDAKSLLTVVAPIFGIHLTLVVRYFATNMYSVRGKGRVVSLPFVFVSVAAPLVLFVATVTTFVAYALGLWNVSLEETRLTLAALEALFGIYLGIVIGALFKSP